MRFHVLPLAAFVASALAWPAYSSVRPEPSERRLAHISIVSSGHGAPLVLIPGLATPRAVWDSLGRKLARNHQVILVQVNGFAGDPPGENLKAGLLSGVTSDLYSFLVDNKIAHVRITGHSLGGLVALQLAKDHPELVAKLMIVDSLPYIGDIFVPGATVSQLEPQAKTIRDQITASYGKPDPALAERTAATMALSTAARSTVALWIEKADSRVVAEAMFEDLTTDLRPDMDRIKTPITLVYPFSDAMPKERADRFYHGEYASAPNVAFVPVANSGHFVMLDQPEALEAAVSEFAK